MLNDRNRRAARLRSCLLKLSKTEKDPQLRSHLFKLATLTRHVFDGYMPGEIRSKLLEVFQDYSDGDTANALTAEDLVELTGIPAYQMDPVLERMLRDGDIVSEVRMMDYHQPGDHSEESFALNLDRPNRKPVSPEPTFEHIKPAGVPKRRNGRAYEITTKVRQFPEAAFVNA